MKKLFLVLCMGSLSMAACTREKASNDIDTNTAATTRPESVEADGTDYENEYRDRALRMSSRMASEMHFDTTTQARVEQAYINRQRRLNDLRKKYNFEAEGNVRAGGTAPKNNYTAMNPEMITELKTIDVDIDNEFRSFLTPAQFKLYETNRANYWEDNQNLGSTQREITRDGDEIKVKAGDIKVKAEPGKSKVVTPTYVSEIDGEKRKFKSKVDNTNTKNKEKD